MNIFVMMHRKLSKANIASRFPVSGRHWKKKIKSASSAGIKGVFNQPKKGNLSVTVRTRKSYNYLYYPDDGSNTRNHQGNQHFMQKGAEDSQEQIIDALVERLSKKVEE